MYLSCDIGGTKGTATAFEALDSTTPLREYRFPMTRTTKEAPGDFDQDYHRLLQTCQSLKSEYGNLEGVALAVAGKVDPSRSTILSAGNIDHWSGRPFVKALSLDLGARVVLGNDAEAAAYAEVVYGGLGQDQTYRHVDFMGMIWGTGVGGCCVRYRGEQVVTIPAEPGHQCIQPNGNLCGCGQLGCLEAYVGGSGLFNHYHKPAERLSRVQWHEVIQRMVVGLRGILTIQPVDLVVFSGGVICKQEWLLKEIESQLKHRMLGSPELRLSPFGETAGALGALSLFSL